MMFRSADYLCIPASFALSLGLTPAVRVLARRTGMVSRPKSDRWHKEPTALLGGLAIAATVLAVAFGLLSLTPPARMILIASMFLFVVGLVDDVLPLKPYQKLIGQVMGAALVTSAGLTLPWTGSPPLDLAITLFWLVGITNAVNLLDNMDGLAAGIAAIASCSLAINFSTTGHATDALMLAVFGAALLGYLVYNSYPASIFMGDCGSMFIGFLLAAAVLLDPESGRSRSFLAVIAVPVLILFIPIFDTMLVMILRKLAGRAASRGGRDHTSHRLVALGLSERRAVWMLYGFAALSGLLGLMVRNLALDISLAAILGFTIVLTLLGVHLAGVKVYDEAEIRAARTKPLVAFLINLSYKRRIFEVLLDVALILLSYYLAYALVYGSISGHRSGGRFLVAVPVLLTVKLASLAIVGVYRGLWRYVSLDDLVVIARGVVLGSIVSVLTIMLASPTAAPSRVVWVLDGLILLLFAAGSRLAFRLFRRFLPFRLATGRRRVLIFGAGDGGELLARELINNPTLSCLPVGFADDDPLKKGKVIHGLRVLGGNGSFLSICTQHAVDEVVISSMRLPPERIEQIARDCGSASVSLKRMILQVEPLTCGGS